MNEGSSWGMPVLAGMVLLALVALIAVVFGGSFVQGGPVGALEVRFPVPVGDPTGEEFRDLEGGVLLLGPAHRFELSTVREAVDDLGEPALYFELVEDQQARFRTLTGARVGQKMAVIAGGWVMTAPVIEDELPGRGLIRARADWTVERVQAALTAGYQ